MPEELRAKVAQQVELYGEPLGDLVGRIASSLAMSRARIADVIGVSPAMLSQLCSGQRVKIGNPAVVERLGSLDDLARRGSAGQLTTEDLPVRLGAIKAATGGMPRTGITRGQASPPMEAVRTVQGVLRAVASADELLESAAILEPQHPALAEVLRVYGAGRTDAAVAHFVRIESLL